MVIHNNFRSWCLQTNTDVEIVIPDPPQGCDLKEFYLSGKKLPVLWLLHGTWGGYTDFLRRTNVDMYAKECNLMVVMVNAMNSDYSNWPNFMLGYNMYDFLTEELMPMIYGYFPGSTRREDNFICGLSMGAMGAVKYTVNHPDLFAGCSAMSGTPIDVRRQYNDGTLSDRELRRVESAGGIDAFLNSYENVWEKLPDFARMDNPPKLLFTIGTEDFLYEPYMEFKAYAESIGLPAVFRETPGYGHEWRLWEIELQKSLEFFGFKGVRNITRASDMGTTDKIDATFL